MKQTQPATVLRIRFWYGVLVAILLVFAIRLFYLQVIRHGHYQAAAQANQLKQYEISAQRGGIYAMLDGQQVPLVLNEVRYTIYTDPKYIEDPADAALKVQQVIGGDASSYQQSMLDDESRYQILAKQVTKEKAEQIQAIKLKGVGAQPENYRTYPQGSLAAQVLGFVNNEGVGTYGIEQALHNELTGTPGQLKAITDVNGVPLAANQDNIEVAPINGRDVVLSLDLSVQSQLEAVLQKGLKDAQSKSGSALVMDVKTGRVVAMANYPTYNPDKYYDVKDSSVFTNPVVSEPLEIGSVMKPFTAAAAVNEGVVSPSTTYYDPSVYEVDGYKITNIEEDGGAATRSVSEILQYSLNTGATWLLMQLGGGELNQQGRTTWHRYMTEHYQFGKLTGIEQGYEAAGTIPDPQDGFGLNLRYANTSFGQGMTATPLQVGSGLVSLVNGGTYYKPSLVRGYINEDGNLEEIQAQVIKKDVISTSSSDQLISMMENVVDKNYLNYRMQKPKEGYSIGGKTGTAEIANPEGGYYDDRFNGTFMGFVGGARPEYVIVVRVNEPKIPGYAGSQAAAPIFGSITEMLINNIGIVPAP